MTWAVPVCGTCSPLQAYMHIESCVWSCLLFAPFPSYVGSIDAMCVLFAPAALTRAAGVAGHAWACAHHAHTCCYTIHPSPLLSAHPRYTYIPYIPYHHALRCANHVQMILFSCAGCCTHAHCIYLNLNLLTKTPIFKPPTFHFFHGIQMPRLALHLGSAHISHGRLLF